MSDDSLVMIFAEPSLYFFPQIKGLVYSPFCPRYKGVWRFIYRALNLAGCPLCRLFWGEWKEKVKTVKMAVIFDFGYEKGMEIYIKKVNPACQVYLFCWNKVDRAHSGYKDFRFPENIFSTDPGDCRRYGFRYNHMFYPSVENQPAGESNRLFFVGADKGRADDLAVIGRLLKNCGVVCDIRILRDKKTEEKPLEENVTVINHPIAYPEYLENAKRSGILLEMMQPGQTALSMRTVEAMFFSKKLITNNPEIVNCDFYSENNIFLLPKNLGTLTGEEIHAFLEKPFVPYPKEILDAYGFEHWKKGFCEFGKAGL